MNIPTYRSLIHSMILMFRKITIEPVVFMYLMSIGLNEVVRPMFLVEKACLTKIGLSEKICRGNLSNETSILVQKEVSQYEMTLNIASIVPRILFVLLGGYWSDTHAARKPIIILPLIGQVMVYFTWILNYVFIDLFPFEALYLEFISELCGSFVIYYLAIYSYIADITSPSERTTRISLLDGIDYTSTMLGTYISGPIFALFGFLAIYVLGCSFSIGAVLYCVYFVKESRAYSPIQTCPSETSSNSESQHVTTVINDKCGGLFSAFTVFCRLRQRSGRLVLLLLLFNFICYIFAYNGTEGTHRQLLLIQKYNWNVTEISRYLSFYRLIYLLALWLCVPLLSRFFGLPDTILIIIACACSSIGCLLPVVFQSSWSFYAGALIAGLNPSVTIVVRALISSVVEPHELGRAFSLLSLASAASSSLISATFILIYRSTLDVTYLIIVGVLYAITIPSNIYVYKALRQI